MTKARKAVSKHGASTAVVTVTFDRPAALQRLVRSVRHFYPSLPIYVGDQSQPDPFMEAFCSAHDVRVVRTGWDTGVGASRNAVIATVEEENILLCDDDMIFTDETRIEVAENALAAMPDVGVIGGRCRDISIQGDIEERRNLFWELDYLYDPDRGIFVTIPIHVLRPAAIEFEGHNLFPADCVLNFALFRRSVFTDRIRWDPQFKSNGEHEDFYLNWKTQRGPRILYLPSMVVDHHRPAQTAYSLKRDRAEGWRRFMDKWRIRRHLELGYGLRAAESVAEVTRMMGLGFAHKDLAEFHRARFRYYFGDSAVMEEMRESTLPRQAAASDQLVPRVAASADSIVLHASYRREHRIGEDLIIYLRAESRNADAGTEVGNMLTLTWLRGDTYLGYNFALNMHRHAARWGEWTAFAVPAPATTGALTLEIAVQPTDGSRLERLAQADMIFTEHRQFGDTNDWVYGWSRPEAKTTDADGSQFYPDELIGVTPQGVVRMLTIRQPTPGGRIVSSRGRTGTCPPADGPARFLEILPHPHSAPNA